MHPHLASANSTNLTPPSYLSPALACFFNRSAGILLDSLEQGVVASGAEELLQHEVVGVLPLIKQHGRGEAHGADEEGQPREGGRVEREERTNVQGEKCPRGYLCLFSIRDVMVTVAGG